MLFSSATRYALRALAFLPADGSYYLAKDLARELELPGPFLAKILQNLVQAGLMESIRGPRGGFRLARPASEIRIGDVLAALEGPDALCGCVMGFPDCGDAHPCPLHGTWGQVKRLIDLSLTQATVQELQELAHREPAPRAHP